MFNDEDLLRQATNCPIAYFDGLGAFRKINGVLRSVGFIIGSGAQLNVLISLKGAEAANRETRRVLDEIPGKDDAIWSGSRTAH